MTSARYGSRPWRRGTNISRGDASRAEVLAATVIPLLLIAVMATRSLRVGEFSRQAPITLLIFGLPVLAELAAFAFLFFEPVPAAAAVILAVATWAGLLSQLAVAARWCAGLIERAGRPAFTLAHAQAIALAPALARMELTSVLCPASSLAIRYEHRFGH